MHHLQKQKELNVDDEKPSSKPRGRPARSQFNVQKCDLQSVFPEVLFNPSKVEWTVALHPDTVGKNSHVLFNIVHCKICGSSGALSSMGKHICPLYKTVNKKALSAFISNANEDSGPDGFTVDLSIKQNSQELTPKKLKSGKKGKATVDLDAFGTMDTANQIFDKRNYFPEVFFFAQNCVIGMHPHSFMGEKAFLAPKWTCKACGVLKSFNTIIRHTCKVWDGGMIKKQRVPLAVHIR